MAAQADELPEGAYHPDPPKYRGLRALSAAGKRLDIRARTGGKRLISRPESWQEDMWSFYDTVPEIKFIGRFYGNALSRIRLVPSVIVDPNEAPLPVDQAVESEADGGVGLSQNIADLAMEVTERLASSPEGMAGLMRGFGENLSIVGDSVLVGRDADDGDEVVDDEVWQVYSTSAITETGDGDTRKVTLKETPNDKTGTVLTGDPSVYRIWRRHARWPGLADSNLSACTSECEELLVWSGLMRAVGRSGTAAGMLAVPDELELVEDQPRIEPGSNPVAIDPNDQDPLDGWSPLERRLMDQFMHPAENPGDAASVTPAIVRGKAEALKELRYIGIERKIDEKIIERIEFLIRRLAHGADLPVEVLTGVADANHWTGWQIEDATYKSHVEPTAQIPAAALTAVHLRAIAREENVPADILRRLVYGLDPAALVVRPNRAADAFRLHRAGALSDGGLLDAHNFADNYLPSDDERLRRYALERGIGSRDLTVELLNRTILSDEPVELPSAPAEGDDETGDDEGDAPVEAVPPEEGGEPTPEAARLALVAASVDLPGLGRQLAAIERGLRQRLQVAASAELETALRRAGTRLRAAVQGQPEAGNVNGQAPETVGLLIGADRAAELVDVDALLAGAFDGLRDRWDAWLAAAEAEAVGVVNATAGTDDGRTVEVTEPADSERGWAALSAGLLALAGARLFAAVEDGPGEVDVHSAVPAGIVRDALAVAGGTVGGVPPHGTASQTGPAGLLTGPRWQRALSAMDILADSWEWQTGFPSAPFEPHQRLSGTIFETWDDPELSNGMTWPRTSHFYPGDHRGCQCDAIAVLVRRT
jgi:hypothetical protein